MPPRFGNVGYRSSSSSSGRSPGTARQQQQRSQRTSSRGAQRGVSGKTTYVTPKKEQIDRNIKNQQQVNKQDKSVQDRKQAYETLKQAGAVTYGGLSGHGLWSKSPVLYEEKLKKAVGPAGQYEEETDRFDPTSERIGQVDLSKTQVDGLTPFYSTMHPDAVHTGNARWKAEQKALSEGKTEEEALAIGYQVNEIFNEAIADRDIGNYTKIEEIMSGKNTALNALVPGGDEGTGWYTGSTANEYGMLGGYLGQDPETGKMYEIDDPTPNILANQASASSLGGSAMPGGYGGGGGGDGTGYYGDPRRGNRVDQMSGFYTPQGNVIQGMINVHKSPTVFKKRGGIVSLLRLN